MSTSTITATIQDPSGQVFANGTYQLIFRPNPNYPGPYTDGGVSFTRIFNGNLDGTGSFSQAGVARNDTISPAGSLWTLIVIPNASNSGYQVDLNVNSANFNATTLINANVSNIAISAFPLSHAYKDSEILGIPSSGSFYYDVTLKVVKVWDGGLGAWQVFPLTGGNPAFASVTIGSLNGIRFVDGIKFTTIQAAINDLPAGGGIVYIPAGTYQQNVSFNFPNSGIALIGAGQDAVTINTTLTTGDLFPINGKKHIRISDMTINNNGAGGANAIRFFWGQYCVLERIQITGPFTNGVVFNSINGSGSTIFNRLSDSLVSGPTVGVVFDSQTNTTQTVNANRLENSTIQGTIYGIVFSGGQGGQPYCNENIAINCQFTGGMAAGNCGVLLNNNSARDFKMEACTLEGSNIGLQIGTGVAGTTAIACEISVNTTQVIDNSGASGRTYITGNIGGSAQIYGVSPVGAIRATSLAFGAAADNGPNTFSFATGAQLIASGTGVVTLNNTSMEANQPIQADSSIRLVEIAAPSGVAGQEVLYADSTSHRLTSKDNNGVAKQLVEAGVDINTSDQVTATHLAAALPTNQGGTGVASLTAHGVLLGEGTGPIMPTVVGATGTVLHGNTGADPTFSAVSLTADVSGVLPTTNGGTGQNSSATFPTSGIIDSGTGTTNTIPKFTNGAAGVLGNSAETDDGTTFTTTLDVALSSGKVIKWNGDTGISRDAAATIDFGNGTQGDQSAFCRMSSLAFGGSGSGGSNSINAPTGWTLLASGGQVMALSTTALTVSKTILGTRLRTNQGTAYTSADAAIVLSSGWGTTRTVSAATGFDQALSFSVNATGTGQAANPTIIITFKDGTWTTAPQVLVMRNDLVTPFNTPPHTISVSATAITITFNGTPTASNVYSYIVHVIGV